MIKVALVSTIQPETHYTRYKLQDNIIFAGPLSGKKLFKTVKSSKVFLLPSYEEGWGIALCEALYAGLPVICYDLPAFKIFSKVIDKYPVGDTDSASAQIGYYLNNPKAIQKKVPLLQETAKQYSWQEIAEKELKILKNTL
jgi:glycosyltransferase involved in cell wall biosynthesis